MAIPRQPAGRCAQEPGTLSVGADRVQSLERPPLEGHQLDGHALMDVPASTPDTIAALPERHHWSFASADLEAGRTTLYLYRPAALEISGSFPDPSTFFQDQWPLI